MASTFKVCVVAPTTLVGETLLEILEARAFPIGELLVAGRVDAALETISFRGEDHTIQDVDQFDFSQCDLAFFCGDRALSQAYVPQAAEAGAIVIDDSDAFRNDSEIPLVVPEVNIESLANYELRHIVANPNSCVILMALTLKPLMDTAGLSRVNAVSLQAVSGVGREAVQELAQQSIALFNQKPMEIDIFHKQIAYNLLPQIGALDEAGRSGEETKIMQELLRVLQNTNIGVNVTSVRVPVFYGHSLVLHIETQRKLSAEAARALLEAAPGVVLFAEEEGVGYPTPLAEAAANDPVFVGRVREDASHPHGLDMWVVSDNLRKGGALNMVQIAENLVEKYLG